MKKRLIWNFLLLTIIILFATEFASSVELTLSKDNYYPQETLQAEFTGTFVTFSLDDNIRIYKQGVPRLNPVDSGLTKRDDVYYFYAVLPNKEGNYSLVIENTEYISDGEIKKDRIVKDFTIKKSNNTYLSINPGFVVTLSDFSIKIKSPYKNKKITTTIQSSNQTQSINLIESEERTIYFSIPNMSEGRTNLIIGDYIIPLFVLKTTLAPGSENLVFYPTELKGTVTSGENYFFKIALQNQGDINITNIMFSNTLNANISPQTIDLLKKGETKAIDVSIPVSDKTTNNLTGEITAQYGNKTKNLLVFFDITTNKTEINLSGTTITPGLHCAGRGKICIYPERCTKDTTESLEGPCCLGDCKTPQKPADYNWIFGLVLLAVLGIVAYFVIKKARSKQKIKTSQEILDERTKGFTGRMNPNPPKEVSGQLDKI